MRFAGLTAFLVSVQSAFGQTVIEGDDSTITLGVGKDITQETRERVAAAPAAILRGLDKMSGSSIDLEANAEDQIEYGGLVIDMHECRYPEGNPSGDAYVRMTIAAKGITGPVFEGWMVASSPALNALDHPRYDVWVIRCKLDDRTPSVVAGESSPRPLMRPEG